MSKKIYLAACLSMLANQALSATPATHVAVASYTSDKTGASELLSYITRDNGKTWTPSAVPPVAKEGMMWTSLINSTCDSLGQHCISIGMIKPSIGSVAPISYISDNGGETWSEVPINAFADFYTFHAISCDSFGRICVAMGSHLGTSLKPVSYTSTDGGKSWNVNANIPTLSDSENHTYTSDIKCDSSGKSCIIVGSATVKNGDSFAIVPVVNTTIDSGLNWSLATSQPQPINSEENSLNSVACDNSMKHCVAVGHYWPKEYETYPLIYISNDGGQHWQRSDHINVDKDVSVNLDKIACDASATKCTVIGNSTDKFARDKPVAYYSEDGGESWHQSADIPAAKWDSTNIQNLYCDINDIQCIAVGVHNHAGFNNFVTLYSNDGGHTWNHAEKRIPIRKTGYGFQISVA